mmetsp:Transcript_24545/g.67770  ORF Transcript_24545/g.67770 Transcript_24545/m.67770 type:complete len:152 (-) Transcript_24545:74-529(-)
MSSSDSCPSLSGFSWMHDWIAHSFERSCPPTNLKMGFMATIAMPSYFTIEHSFCLTRDSEVNREFRRHPVFDEPSIDIMPIIWISFCRMVQNMNGWRPHIAEVSLTTSNNIDLARRRQKSENSESSKGYENPTRPSNVLMVNTRKYKVFSR